MSYSYARHIDVTMISFGDDKYSRKYFDSIRTTLINNGIPDSRIEEINVDDAADVILYLKSSCIESYKAVFIVAGVCKKVLTTNLDYFSDSVYQPLINSIMHFQMKDNVQVPIKIAIKEPKRKLSDYEEEGKKIALSAIKMYEHFYRVY
ncbi:uncharacterized protein SAPINGB_P005721 [Magnusiomyces paraingens]|uniref:6,7-dimethyl-8-ribityllumazine synthase n=1 Tax=Magnusiomyces paraingens TaxID=2606893 RepID=A0A5E8C0T5_9ASCO|nr:uncharacterized protein SAPINGB_P005721 [Saprochaete ingens]VVT57489.1 unnamed protein product [Saprochaete ingens]